MHGYFLRPARRWRPAAEALFGVALDGNHAALLLFVDSESGDQAEIVAGAYEIAAGASRSREEPPAATPEPSSPTARRFRAA